MGRRAHGEGSIYKRGDGRWCATIDCGWKEGSRDRKYLYGRTQAEVRSQLVALRAQVDSGLPAPNDRMTIADLLGVWLEHVRKTAESPNTVEHHRWVVQSHLIPALGKYRVAELAPRDVTGFLADRAGQGLSKSSCIRFRTVLGQALRLAEIEGWVQRNVARLSDIPRIPGPEGRSMTADQAGDLLAALEQEPLGGLFTIMLTMGLRLGEATGVPWDAIDLEARTLAVRQTVKREPGGLRIGDTKTKKSRRTLAIPDVAFKALRSRRITQTHERLAAGPTWHDSGLVFTTSVGTLIDPKNLRRTFNRITQTAGLGRWTPTELRHSAVSLMSAAGVPLEHISDIAGHDGTRMTGGIYRHVLAPVIDHGVQAMDDLFGNTG
jgi:integrase